MSDATTVKVAIEVDDQQAVDGMQRFTSFMPEIADTASKVVDDILGRMSDWSEAVKGSGYAFDAFYQWERKIRNGALPRGFRRLTPPGAWSFS